MELNNRHVVIMAGGIGSRLWPISTPEYSKQFIDVMGCGCSLLQSTINRFLPLCPIEHIWVVTSLKDVDAVHEQLPDLPTENILAEPEPRSTAPCIGYACWKIMKKYPKANIVVTPSDALVVHTDEFHRVIEHALEFTEKNSAIVTIGIKPDRPETGYGYICTGLQARENELTKVQAFKEKPDLNTARLYLEAGNYFWNAGIFVWNTDTILSSFRTYTPNLADVMDEMAKDFYTEQEKSTLARLFPTCEKISIDYAVMEKANYIYTIPADFGWSDLGSWNALYIMLAKDENGNAVVGGNVRLVNCKNCIVHTSGKKKVVLEGLEDSIVAERNGKLLICKRYEDKRIQEFAR